MSQKMSKERERLLAEGKKALAGLGMSNQSAVALFPTIMEIGRAHV